VAALTAALCVGMLQGAPAQAAPTETTAPLSRGAFEGVSDDPVPVPAGEVEQPVGVPDHPELPDYPAGRAAPGVPKGQDEAMAAAAASGQPVEIRSLTTESTIAYAQPDGTVQVQSSGGPVRTEVGGAWVDVDTTLEFTDDGVQPVAVPGDIRFSDGGREAMARLGDGGDTTMWLGWNGPLPTPELAGNVATYRNVLPQVDLVLTANRTGFEQHVVVNQRPSRATLAGLAALQFPLDTRGATVRQTTNDELVIEKGGKVVGTGAAPLMWDARIDPGTDEPVAVRPVGLDLAAPTVAGTDATVVLSADQSFLTDPGTVYPVTIDPTQALGPIGTTFVQSNISNTPQGGSTELRTGTYGGGVVARSFVKFDVSPAFDRVITSATLGLWEFHSYSCTPFRVDVHEAGDFDPNATTWNSRPWIGGSLNNVTVARGYSSSCPAGWVDFDLTGHLGKFSDARNGMSPVMALAVLTNEGDVRGWKKFNSGMASGGVPTLTYAYDGVCDQYYGNRVCGAIRDKYYASGGPSGSLGFPLNSETSIRGGAFNHFERGSIYWSPATGAHIIWGSIRDKWASMGWENSSLGYPTTDEIGIRGGRSTTSSAARSTGPRPLVRTRSPIRSSTPGEHWAGRTAGWATPAPTPSTWPGGGAASSRAATSSGTSDPTPPPSARVS
jgi:hypothetical protein